MLVVSFNHLAMGHIADAMADKDVDHSNRYNVIQKKIDTNCNDQMSIKVDMKLKFEYR